MRFAAPLLASLFLLACTKTNPAEVAAARDAGTTVVTSSVAVIRGPAWTMDVTRFAPPNVPDALTFHGWSSDGQRYAFEYYVAAVAADCEDRYHLYIVDARSDRYVTGGALELARDQPEGDAEGRCEPADLSVVMDKRRVELLERHGIVAGNLRPPHRLTKKDGRWIVAWSNGNRSMIDFEVKHRVGDPYGPEAEAGAAYLLKLDGRTLEPGTRRRAGILRYGLDEALMFESPDDRHAALIVQRYERGFEGARVSWMSNGFIR